MFAGCLIYYGHMKKTVWIMCFVAIVIAIALAFADKVVAPVSTGERFEGTISAVDTSCFFDAICSVTIDGKRVIVIIGGRRIDPLPEVGNLIGVESIGDVESRIGDKASVYAEKTAEGDYTLYGSSEYYIEVLGGE